MYRKLSAAPNFLAKQIEHTNVADIKAVLYKLIEEQAKPSCLPKRVTNTYLRRLTLRSSPNKRPSPSGPHLSAGHPAWRYAGRDDSAGEAFCEKGR
jgi:hypothetical protein